MDEFMKGISGINIGSCGVVYIEDEKGRLIDFAKGCISDIKFEEDDNSMDKKKEEMLIELQEKLEVMSNAISDVQYLVDAELHDDEKDRNIDLKMIIKLNRIEDELESCFDMIIEDNL